MKNVTIQISDELYEKFKTLPDDPAVVLDVSVKLLRAIVNAILPKEDPQ